MLSASAIAGYTLYLAYFHAVQTDEIKEDGTQEVADLISEQLNLIRVEEIARIRSEFASGSTAMSVPARLALIAGGLSVPEQRRVMPTLSLLLRAPDPTQSDDEQSDHAWYSVRDIALILRDSGQLAIKFDSIQRQIRRKLADNAERYPDQIRATSERGWIVDPALAIALFNLPDAPASDAESATIIDADPPVIVVMQE